MADELEQEVATPPDESTIAAPDDNQVRDIREVDGSGDMPSPVEIPDTTAEATSTEETPVETSAETPTAEEIQSLRDAASEAGYDVSSMEDDASVLQHLINQAKQAETQQQQLTQYQQMLAAQQVAQAQPQAPSAKEEKLWDPPEFNPHWLSQVTRDADGNLVPSEGGTPDTVQKVLAYARYRDEQRDKFWSDPFSYMKPMVEQVAREQITSGLQANQETTTAQQIIEKNSEWIYDGDPGQGKFTPDGQLLYDSIREIAESIPNSSSQQQYTYAMAQVEKSRAARELNEIKSQQEAAKTHEERKRAAVGSPKPNSSGTLQDEIQNPGLSLKEKMAAALAQAGVTAIDLEGST